MSPKKTAEAPAEMSLEDRVAMLEFLARENGWHMPPLPSDPEDAP